MTPGKARRIQTVADSRGVFKILAADHRDSMRALIDPDHPEDVPASTLTDIKLAVIRGVGAMASGVLLDPVYSAQQAIVSGALSGQVGFLSAIEEQGYLGDPHSRQTTLLTGWSVEKAARLGASGIKLLIFYNPNAGDAADRQDELVSAVVADCARYDIPLFLEPLGYPLESQPYDREQVTIETARRLSALHPDVLKLQFPVDGRQESSPETWQESCAKLAEACAVPWALLSFGDPYDLFKAQLEVACEAGCSGFMAGRAVWREVITAPAGERAPIVGKIVLPRFKGLCEVVDRHAAPWTTKADPPDHVPYHQF